MLIFNEISGLSIFNSGVFSRCSSEIVCMFRMGKDLPAIIGILSKKRDIMDIRGLNYSNIPILVVLCGPRVGHAWSTRFFRFARFVTRSKIRRSTLVDRSTIFQIFPRRTKKGTVFFLSLWAISFNDKREISSKIRRQFSTSIDKESNYFFLFVFTRQTRSFLGLLVEDNSRRSSRFSRFLSIERQRKEKGFVFLSFSSTTNARDQIL